MLHALLREIEKENVPETPNFTSFKDLIEDLITRLSTTVSATSAHIQGFNIQYDVIKRCYTRAPGTHMIGGHLGSRLVTQAAEYDLQVIKETIEDLKNWLKLNFNSSQHKEIEGWCTELSTTVKQSIPILKNFLSTVINPNPEAPQETDKQKKAVAEFMKHFEPPQGRKTLALKN